MQIKAADDRQPDIDALEALLQRPNLSASTRRRLQERIWMERVGAKGEQEAAYQLEFHYGKNLNQMTIHDLRLELDGRVAQIDHLLINRILDIWVLESKHFADGVEVNEHGEWTALDGERRRGIPSPIEQNRRQIKVLASVFDHGLVQMPKRLGIAMKPRVRGLVLVSNNARIVRPAGRVASRIDGLDAVIKVDQLEPTLEHAYDKAGIVALTKAIGRQTVEHIGRSLAALHTPLKQDWAGTFGLERSNQPELGLSGIRPTCGSCERRVSDAEVAFSHAHRAQFSGQVLCIDCQRKPETRSPGRKS